MCWMGDAGCGSWKSEDIGWVGVRVGGETGRRDGEIKKTLLVRMCGYEYPPGEDGWMIRHVGMGDAILS